MRFRKKSQGGGSAPKNVRFIHTGDWQLGMTRHFLEEEAQARFTQARFDAVRAIGKLAQEEHASFVLVCGDVFESNLVDRKTVLRALEAMASIPVPVFLLPGNHDPLDAASVFRSSTFKSKKPPNVRLLADTKPVAIEPGVELVGAPWHTKRPLADLVSQAVNQIPRSTGVIRIVAGHGDLDSLSPNQDNPALISSREVERAISEELIHYVALGERHSVTRGSDTDRVWFSGTPEATDYLEEKSGCALIVDVSPSQCQVQEKKTGSWQFVHRSFEFSADIDVGQLESFLKDTVNKDKTIVRLGLKGVLSLEGKARLDELIQEHQNLYAAIVVWERVSNIVLKPTDLDLEKLSLSGFAKEALAKLQVMASDPSCDRAMAQDAICLMYRLSRGKSS